MVTAKQINAYLRRNASKWVSAFVLTGCVAITGVLVFAAMQASALGDRFVDNTGWEDHQ